MPRPIASQATTNTARFGAAAWISRPIASRTALAASTGRPPNRSMSRPTRGDASPDVSSPSESAPMIQAGGQPVAPAIGPASTASR